MEYEISKELFEAVMNKGKLAMFDLYKDTIYCYFAFKGHTRSAISINDFFFKCKEWALNQHYYLRSGYQYNKVNKQRCSLFTMLDNNWDKLIYHFDAETEQQAVFTACQWILENKDKQ